MIVVAGGSGVLGRSVVSELTRAGERVRVLARDTAYAESNRPHAAIIDAARARGCDLIIMSSRGRSGLSKLWYGSETRAVLRNSTIPTLVYR